MGARLLVVGHAGVPTGYARVLAELLPRLGDELDVTVFAFNYKSGPLPNAPAPTRTNELRGDVLGREQLPAILREVQPDVVLLHHDPDVFAVHAEALDAYRRERPGTRVVVYCPIEWETTSVPLLQTLASVDTVVTYTRFGERVVRTALEGLSNARVTSIPHGATPHRFVPLHDDPVEARRIARRRLFPDRPQLAGALVILNANRNSPRKRIDITLRAFSEFAAGKADAYLCLHMGMDGGGIHVPRRVSELGVEDQVLTTTSEQWLPELSDEALNVVYNACDVGLNTSTGEGWGLVAFEHGATGAAQVVPAHSACEELWRDKALLIPVEAGREEEGVVSIDGTIAALERLYARPDLRDRLGAAARSHALDPRFDWDTIAQSWKTLLLREAQLAGSS